ncbi:hypothetical protein ACSBR2_038623 [Camellia fascicularis]
MGTSGWSPNKLQHILFCFSITIIFSLLASLTRYSFLRRRTIWFGSIVSLSAGAAKEVADELGFFKSAGASAKDAVADLLGILLAVLVLSHQITLSADQTRSIGSNSRGRDSLIDGLGSSLNDAAFWSDQVSLYTVVCLVYEKMIYKQNFLTKVKI